MLAFARTAPRTCVHILQYILGQELGRFGRAA